MIYRLIFGLIIAVGLSATAVAQDSVLAEEPLQYSQAAPAVQPAPVHPSAPSVQPVWLIRRGLLGWRATPAVVYQGPLLVVAPPPRPVVVWTPTIIWR